MTALPVIPIMGGRAARVRITLAASTEYTKMKKSRAHASRLLPPAVIASVVALGMLAVGGASAGGLAPVGLGTAEPFAVLAGTPSVTNVGPTIITGNVGIHPGASVTGFPPGTVNGTIHEGDEVALQAKSDLVAAYDDAAGRTPATTVTGGLLGGQTLVGGVYNSGGLTFDLTGTLTLDGQNDPSSVWIFQATSDLITASSSSVAFINGGSPCNVFWQVTSSATLGSGSSFAGTILALTSITMADGVTVDGRALARNGNVTLINDEISIASCFTPAAPTPTATPTGTPTAAATPLLPNTALNEGDGNAEGTSPHWLRVLLSGLVALGITRLVVNVRRSTAYVGRRTNRAS